MEATAFSFIFIIFIVFGAALYFIPTVVAFTQKKQSKWAIFALNLFAGWTFIGWIGSLIWALMQDPVKE